MIDEWHCNKMVGNLLSLCRLQQHPCSNHAHKPSFVKILGNGAWEKDKQGRVELSEVSVDTQGPQRENSWKVSAANLTRQRRVSSIVLNACIPDGTKEYGSDMITNTTLASMVLFMVRFNNNLLHDRFITWIDYAVSSYGYLYSTPLISAHVVCSRYEIPSEYWRPFIVTRLHVLGIPVCTGFNCCASIEKYYGVLHPDTIFAQKCKTDN